MPQTRIINGIFGFGTYPISLHPLGLNWFYVLDNYVIWKEKKIEKETEINEYKWKSIYVYDYVYYVIRFWDMF